MPPQEPIIPERGITSHPCCPTRDTLSPQITIRPQQRQGRGHLPIGPDTSLLHTLPPRDRHPFPFPAAALTLGGQCTETCRPEAHTPHGTWQVTEDIKQRHWTGTQQAIRTRRQPQPVSSPREMVTESELPFRTFPSSTTCSASPLPSPPPHLTVLILALSYHLTSLCRSRPPLISLGHKEPSAWGGNSGHGHSRCPSPLCHRHIVLASTARLPSHLRGQGPSEQSPRGTPPFLVCSWGQRGVGVTRHQPSRQVNGVSTCPCAEHPSPWSLSQQSRGWPGQEHSHSTPTAHGGP